MSFLRIKNVFKRFADVEVLKGIDIEIEKGDFLVLVGPSGCGKSTLLNMVAGLDTMTEGEIWIGDQVMNDVHPSNRDIAMVFQSYALYPNMTVAKNISFGLEMRKVPKAERDEAVARVSKMLQIDPLLKRKPSQLSGGQRQRVAMGRALVRDPQVFLFDEPLSNLDAKLRVDMRTEIKLMHQRLGVTVVYVTHDQIEAMTLATRIAVLKAGELQQLGTPQMVYDDPANTFVAGFMGSPSMNLVPGTVRERDGKFLAEITTGENGTVALPFVRDLEGLARYKDQEVIVGVRPEAITDTQSANRDEGVIHEADLMVEVTEPTGSDTFVVTALGGKEAVARMRVNAPAKAGESCRFAFDVARMVAFDRESQDRIR